MIDEEEIATVCCLLSRNEIAKLKSLCESRQRQCDELKGIYASQLLKTNKVQSEYFHQQLPAVLDGLQSLEVGNKGIANRKLK